MTRRPAKWLSDGAIGAMREDIEDARTDGIATAAEDYIEYALDELEWRRSLENMSGAELARALLDELPDDDLDDVIRSASLFLRMSETRLNTLEVELGDARTAIEALKREKDRLDGGWQQANLRALQAGLHAERMKVRLLELGEAPPDRPTEDEILAQLAEPLRSMSSDGTGQDD